MLGEIAGDLTNKRYFLCGPGEFMDALRQSLLAAGVPAKCIHTEQFHQSTRPAATAK
jgi:ferredoxin-NADP reductase